MAIRILHVAQSPGGVLNYIKMLLKYIDSSKFENILVCSQDYDYEDFRGLVDSFEQVKMQREIGVDDVSAILAVRRLIKKYRPDVVYAHSSKAGAVARAANIGLKNSRGKKIRCIYNPHGWAYNMRCGEKKQAAYAAVERLCALFCDRIICISDAERNSALERKICPESKLVTVYNGVDVEAYDRRGASSLSRRGLNIPEDAFVVGMVGRLCEQKAPDVFVQAAARIKDRIPNAFFVIVGDGEQRQETEALARELGLENHLLITGWVNNPVDYIELFDVAVLMSRWEGLCLSICEYMLAKKPVVATNATSNPEIIADGVNGLLVEVDDARGAARAVCRLFEEPELRAQMGERGNRIVRERFDVKRVSRETGEVIKRLWN